MKKILLTVLSVTVIAFAGCKKDSSNKPSATTSNTYLPVTKGSTWTYNDVTAGKSDTRTITLTGATTQINGKTYDNITINTVSSGNTTGYLFASNHQYAMRVLGPQVAITLELQLGLDNQTAGYSWTTTPTDDGKVEGFPTRLVNTIKETGITKTVNGKSYSNVIHTQANLQYDFGTGYTTAGTYDYYLAKGVGLIELTLNMNGSNYETETLSSYSIK
jgi:hypothetical protein